MVVVPMLSMMMLLPRATPAPPLRFSGSVSVDSVPLPNSKLSEVRAKGAVSVSTKPAESFWLVDTSCLTINVNVPGIDFAEAIAVRMSLLLLLARADLKIESRRKDQAMFLKLSRRELMSNSAVFCACSDTSRA